MGKALLPKSVFVRFTMAFVVAGLLPLAFFTGVTMARFTSAIEDTTVQSTGQMVNLVAENLNSRLGDIAHQTSNMYFYDSGSYGTLRGILSRGKTEEESIAYYGMRDFTKGILDANAGLRNVIFWDRAKDISYSSHFPQTKQLDAAFDWLAEEYIQRALRNPRRLIVSTPHMETYYQRGATKVITLCRAYLDIDEIPMREKILGVLMLDIPYAYLGEALATYDWNAMGELHIINENNESIFSSDEALVGACAPLGLEQSPAMPEGVDISHGKQILYSSIPIVGWQIQFAIDPSALTRRVDVLQRYTYVMILLSALASVLLAFLGSGSLSAPIRSLLKQMKRVQQGDLEARVQKVRQGELGEVCDGFNHMVSELQTHVRRSYLAKIKQQEAELNALKAQIHPHFLYNTLEVIRMTAMENADKPSADMIQALARQLKYVIGEMRDQVPLEKETDLTRNYIHLVSMRYGSIVLDVQIPSVLMECVVLKLCLQPVVENAVQHGLRPNDGGHIRLSAERNGEDLLIQVMDDGKGMTQEQLERVRALLRGGGHGQKTEEGWRSIGLKNVHDRLLLAYGSAYGLEIHSQENIGSVVIIRMPYQRGGEANETDDLG